MQRGKITPKDPFSHAAWLLTNDDSRQPEDDVVDKQIQLSYIGNDKMLRFYQNDAILLTQIKNMAIRDPVLAPVFSVLENSWKSELKLTKVLGGLERQLQGTTGGSYAPRPFEEGFGTQLAEDERERQKNQIGTDTIMGFFKKLGKKKQ